METHVNARCKQAHSGVLNLSYNLVLVLKNDLTVAFWLYYLIISRHLICKWTLQNSASIDGETAGVSADIYVIPRGACRVVK